MLTMSTAVRLRTTPSSLPSGRILAVRQAASSRRSSSSQPSQSSFSSVRRPRITSEFAAFNQTAYVHGLVPAPDDAQRRKLKKLVTQRRWAEAAAFAAAAN